MAAHSKANNPEKIDALFAWVILLGFGFALGWVYVTNLTPYSQFVQNFLFAQGRADSLLNLPLLGALMRWAQTPIATLSAALLFAAIQAGEVWGVWLCLVRRHKLSREKLVAALILALCCFCIDLVAVFNFFPPVSVPLPQFLMAGTWSQIIWGDLITGGIILFGGCLYLGLWQLLRRLA